MKIPFSTSWPLSFQIKSFFGERGPTPVNVSDKALCDWGRNIPGLSDKNPSRLRRAKNPVAREEVELEC